MEIAIIALLFLVGTVASAIQGLRYLERRNKPPGSTKPRDSSPRDQS